MDKKDEFSARPYRAERQERKFIKVNYYYKMNFEEVDRDLLGTPSLMKPDNLKKYKASKNGPPSIKIMSPLIVDVPSRQAAYHLLFLSFFCS